MEIIDRLSLSLDQIKGEGVIVVHVVLVIQSLIGCGLLSDRRPELLLPVVLNIKGSTCSNTTITSSITVILLLVIVIISG